MLEGGDGDPDVGDPLGGEQPPQLRDDERVQQAYLGTGLVLEKNA